MKEAVSSFDGFVSWGVSLFQSDTAATASSESSRIGKSSPKKKGARAEHRIDHVLQVNKLTINATPSHGT